MEDWQLWLGILSLLGLGNLGGFWYGYGKLNQKVDSGFQAVHARLDRMNGRVDRHDEQIADAAVKIARIEGHGSRGASLGD